MATITDFGRALRWQAARMDVVGWIIAANVVMFILARFCGLLPWLELPLDFHALLARPWTPVSYMFTQIDLFHLIFNMLWLYWFATFYLDVCTPKRLAAVYVAGGIVGAVFFLIAGHLLGLHSSHAHLIGSSASVLAVVAATAMLTPDREIGLMIFGNVKLKWVALIMVAFDLVNIGFDNAGGNIAHIGGALTGVAAVLVMRRAWLSPQPQPDKEPLTDAERLDALLDKVRRSGYGSLSKGERAALFEISNRIK